MGDDGHEVYGVYQGRIACSRARASPQGLFSIKLSVSLALHNDTSLKTKVRPRRPTHAPTQQNNASHRHTDSHRDRRAPKRALPPPPLQLQLVHRHHHHIRVGSPLLTNAKPPAPFLLLLLSSLLKHSNQTASARRAAASFKAQHNVAPTATPHTDKPESPRENADPKRAATPTLIHKVDLLLRELLNVLLYLRELRLVHLLPLHLTNGVERG